jgi:fibronectin-binding autotransporter adhesin
MPSVNPHRSVVDVRASKKPRKWWGLASLAASVAIPGLPVFADQWVGGNGNWNVASNWSPAAVPNNNDFVNVTSSAGATEVINYNYTGTAVTLGILTVDLTNQPAGAAETIDMAADTLSAQIEELGQSGAAVFNQSGGFHNPQLLELGAGLGGSTGTYILSGTGVLNSPGETIGAIGDGIFNQTGGTNSAGLIQLNSANNTKISDYNLSGGSLIATEMANFGGTVTFTGGSMAGSTVVQLGGGLFTSPNLMQIGLGNGPTSFTLEGGLLSVGDLNVASGALQWPAGTLAVNNSNVTIGAGGEFPSGQIIGNTDTLNITNSADSLIIAGTLNLSGGVVNAPAISGSGALNWVSGTLNITNTSVTIGDGGPLDAVPFTPGQTLNITNPADTLNIAEIAFTLSGGAISAPVVNSATPIDLASGTLTLTNSSLTVGNGGLLGANLSLTSGQTVQVTNPSDSLNITGSLDLNGGALVVPQIVNSGTFSWELGTLDLTNTSLTIGSGGLLGTSVTIATNQSLVIANPNSSLNITGTLSLSGGTITAPVINDSGIFAANSGDLVLTNSNLTIGSGGLLGADVSLTSLSLAITNQSDALNIAGTGVVTISGGGVTAPAINNSGALNFVSGTLNLTNSNLTLGSGGLLGALVAVPLNSELGVTGSGNSLAIASTGTLNLLGGTINVTGISDSGQFNWTSGTLSIANSVTIGTASGNLGPSLAIGPNQELNVGIAETVTSGTINQTGGMNIAGLSGLIVGENTKSVGVYIMSGGSLNVVGEEEVGFFGTGIFNQSGGTHSVNGPLAIGDAGTGTYILSGSGSLAVLGETIGSDGIGSFNQTGGVNSVGPDPLQIGGSSGTASYSLSGGSVIAANGEQIGAGPALFNQSGGLNSVIGTLSISSNSTVTYLLSGGRISTQAEVIGGNGTVTFNQTAGTNSTGPMNLGNDSKSATYDISGGFAALGSLILSPGAGSAVLTVSGTAQLSVSGTVLAGQSGRLNIDGGTVNLGGLELFTFGEGLVNANSAFYVNYGANADPDSEIGLYLDVGYNGGKWNGLGISSTSVASLNASQKALVYAVGYADGADGIVPGLSSGQIEIIPTIAGDCTLQGTVNFGDFQVLAQHLGGAGGWDEGNFTYGATVDFGDFQLLAQDFAANSSGLSAGEMASLNSFATRFGDALVPNAGSGFSLVAVPEPASISLIMLPLALLARRRKRHISAAANGI